MGSVYRAYDCELDRTVAVKVLRSESVSDLRALLHLKKELILASRVSDQHVVRVHDLGETEGKPLIAMDWVDGENLVALLARVHVLPPSQVWSFAIQICQALRAIHSSGIVHRDLKPGNLLVRRDGEILVADFGLAKSVASQDRAVSQSGETGGTPRYMSPEQLAGLPADPRSDFYSFGLVVLEMLTGTTSLEALDSMRQNLLASEQERHTRSSELRHLAVLDGVIRRCVQLSRAERYSSSDEIFSDLQAAVTDSNGELPAPGPLQAVVAAPRFTPLRRAAWTFAALLILALAGIGYWRSVRAPSSIRSLAVLPFVNVGGDPEWAYLSDGFTESMINSLSRVQDLAVMSRSAVFRLRGQLDPIEQGRRLRVDAVLTGSLRHFSDSLEVTLELVDTATGRHLWGEHYRHAFKDLLDFQRAAIDDAAGQLRSRLDAGEKQRVARSYTGNLDAYRLYLKGRYEWNKRTPTGFDQAIGYFKRALQQDPRYALAYSGIADAYAMQSGWRPPVEIFPLAREAATKALEIDDNLAEAHASLGFIYIQYDWDWPGAERELRQALRLNPNYATAHSMYGRLLEVLGRFSDAESELSKAQQLDPISIGIANGVALEHYFARDYKAAEKAFRENLILDPQSTSTKSFLAYTLVAQGQFGEAVALYRQILAADPGDLNTMAELVRTYATAQRFAEARTLYERIRRSLKQGGSILPTSLAEASLALGNLDEAFSYLNEAYSERCWQLIFLKVDPLWDPLRTDARYLTLLQKMNLTGSA